MGTATSYYQKLQNLFASSKFDQLKSLSAEKHYRSMKSDTREEMAIKLVEQGKNLLEKGDVNALEIFNLSKSIAPFSATVYYRRGKVWFDYSKENKNIKGLERAKEELESALKIQKDHAMCRIAYGSVLTHLGLIQSLPDFYALAIDEFEIAEGYCDKESPLLEVLYWQWGRSQAFYAKYSGEACDFKRAVDLFEKVKESPSSTYWNDYGNALVELACLINRDEILEKSLTCYDKCIEEDSSSCEALLNAACTAQRLYYRSSMSKYLKTSHEYFTLASQVNEENLNLWVKWGELFLTVGKNRRSLRWVKEALEKFVKANELEEGHPQVYNKWAEALLVLGTAKKNLRSIKKAEEKIVKSLSVAPENPDTWYLYGAVLNELGNYFQHPEYHEEALERFQYGLTLDQESPTLWYGLAMSFFALAELKLDTDVLDRSLSCFAKADSFGCDFPQFWSNWGVALLKLGEITGDSDLIYSSIEKFEKSPHVNGSGVPDTESMYHYGYAFDILGDLTDEEGHYEKSVKVFANVLHLDPSYTHARFNLATALSHLGEATGDFQYFEQADEHFRALTDQDHEDDMSWVEWGLSLLNQAQIHQEKEDDELFEISCKEAEVKLTQAAALGNVFSYYPLACLYSLQKQFSLAMHFIQRADQSAVLPSIPELMRDEWIEDLRKTPSFIEFMDHLAGQSSQEGDDMGFPGTEHR